MPGRSCWRERSKWRLPTGPIDERLIFFARPVQLALHKAALSVDGRYSK
jgi:hypothetical protein